MRKSPYCQLNVRIEPSIYKALKTYAERKGLTLVTALEDCITVAIKGECIENARRNHQSHRGEALREG